MGGSDSKPVVVPPGSLGWMGITTSNDDLFDILLIKSPLVLFAWILLALVPKWKFTMPIVQVIGLAFALLYVLIFIDGFYHPTDMTKVGSGKFKTPFDCFYSLEGVHTLFTLKEACFGGWVHYIVFDLWTGLWITRDSLERKIPQLLLIPCLSLTMMLGPCGLFTYTVSSYCYLEASSALSPSPAAKKVK
jgi:hypothetical protein